MKGQNSNFMFWFLPQITLPQFLLQINHSIQNQIHPTRSVSKIYNFSAQFSFDQFDFTQIVSLLSCDECLHICRNSSLLISACSLPAVLAHAPPQIAAALFLILHPLQIRRSSPADSLSLCASWFLRRFAPNRLLDLIVVVTPTFLHRFAQNRRLDLNAVTPAFVHVIVVESLRFEE